jgi:dehydrogenase/reductase SDR family protein 4
MNTTEPIIFKDDHNCKRFVGKNAVVTAGTAGIGLAACHRLCSEGAKVFLCSRKQKNVDDAVKELREKYGQDRAFGVACNVTKPGELENFIQQVTKQFTKVDVVLSNVGVNPTAGKSMEMTDTNYDKIMEANVRSHFRLIKLVSPYLTRPGASIVLVSSVAGFNPEFPLGVYGVSKTALIGLGKALASEMGVDGIRVNTICPGVVRTKLAEMLWKSEYGQQTADKVFLRRLADPWEMSGTIAYLLSDDAGYVTGETIVAGGGVQARL